VDLLVHCPFCDLILHSNSFLKTGEEIGPFKCRNHKDTTVILYDSRAINKINEIVVYKKLQEYILYIYPLIDKMRITDYNHYYLDFPIDKSLTPENFEDKINFYMTFK